MENKLRQTFKEVANQYDFPERLETFDPNKVKEFKSRKAKRKTQLLILPVVSCLLFFFILEV
jgi:hypothetical protein